MDLPKNLRYTKTHEWVRLEGQRAYIGLTDFAQKELGDIVFVELPDLDAELAAGEQLGVVESVKAVADINSPLSGQVVEINEALEDSPELVNEYDSLLTVEAYQKHIEG